MFWRFNYLSSDIDTLLDKENVTLQEILNEEDVLQECKAQNKKLVDFLVQPQHLVELVRYVTEEPVEDMTDKLKYKYPNIACELMTSDVSQITEALVTDKQLLDKIMTFVESDRCLNPLQTSLLGKVVGLLITRKSEVIVEYIKSRDSYVDSLLRHFDTSAVMDMLMRLITSMESGECRSSCVNFLIDQGIVTKLVFLISSSQTPEINSNASNTLCDLICIGREQIIQMGDQAVPDPLLAKIESQDTITQLLTQMFDGSEPQESPIISGLQVIHTLLEFRKCVTYDCKRTKPAVADMVVVRQHDARVIIRDSNILMILKEKLFLEGICDSAPSENVERFSKAITSTVQAIIPRLKCFHNLLIAPPKQHYVPMPWTLGMLELPLGNTRLQVARLIATLLNSNVAAVNEELASLGTVSVLLDLYFKYSWNNFLHRQVELCVAAILTRDSDDDLMLVQLLTSQELIQKITKGFENNEIQLSPVGVCRQGYMGHLTRIANNLINNTVNNKNSQKIDDLIQSLPEVVRDNWEKCKSGSLAEINKRNLCDLISNVNMSSGGDEDEFSRIAFPQSNIAQKFGYNEDDFNERDDDDSLGFGQSRLSLSPSAINNEDSMAMFEDRCSSMGQFGNGDTNTDEDLWVDKEIIFSPTAEISPSSHAAAGPISSGRMVVSDPDSEEDESDELEKRNSSDSDEEDLSSLPRIHQLPDPVVSSKSTAAEDMDVSSADDWAKFDEVPMDVAPESTPAIPWISAVTEAPGTDSDWANFDDAKPDVSTTTAEEGWADFAAFGCSPGIESGSVSESPATPSVGRSSAYAVPTSDDISAVTKHDFDSGLCRVDSPLELYPEGDSVVSLTPSSADNGPS